VIVTDVGDLPTQVTDGVDGLVCAAGDVGSLSGAIDRLYEEGTLEAMRRWICEHPPEDDWPDYVRAVERLGG
jgi:glycosyltransferase involved in cell wall biosynthesis